MGSCRRPRDPPHLARLAAPDLARSVSEITSRDDRRPVAPLPGSSFFGLLPRCATHRSHGGQSRPDPVWPRVRGSDLVDGMRLVRETRATATVADVTRAGSYEWRVHYGRAKRRTPTAPNVEPFHPAIVP